MIDIQDKKECCGCKACEQICPKQSITMNVDNEGFWYPVVNHETCIECSLCEKVCPELVERESITPISSYACYNLDETIRLKSSSGGVFTALAEYVISQQGVVFGARFDKEWNVIHDYTESLSGLDVFRGSKYVQSDIKDSFSKVQSLLKRDKIVLFTGTPCQVSGLKLFLRKEYKNLLTMDFICHGVPSPSIWKSYLKETSPKLDRIKYISFRDKTFGWKKFSLHIQNLNQAKSILEPLNRNLYMKGFLQDLYLRPSCYDCSSKNYTSGSDITVGDFWGIQNEVPEIDDDKGISCILVNTNKGKIIIDKLNLYYKQMELSQIDKYNPALIRSVDKPVKRADFYKSVGSNNTLKILDKYTKMSTVVFLKYKCRGLVKTILQKLGLFELIKKNYAK